jgi:DNA-binding NtrC family response regulator
MILNIVVVDNAKKSREDIASILNASGYHATAYANAFTAMEAIESDPCDLVLTDLQMPSMDGLQFLKEIKSRSPETSVIVMTDHGTVEAAVQAMRAGASDYVTKPFHPEQLRLHVERLREIQRTRRELDELRRSLGVASDYAGFVGNSPEMRKILQQIDQFADRPGTVLITGETGTGKEMVARALHARSTRKTGPFVAVACAAVPRELAESELFGHEAGAYTGAVRRRRGYLEQAQGGTLFLDDVDDLPVAIQPKLLRAIQEREYQRVGGEALLKAELRIIASTKKDLVSLTREGRFREDLLYRLQVLKVYLPPLRERKGDVLALAQHFLKTHGNENAQPAKLLSAEAEKKLLRHAWPGNVRELRHAIEYAMAVAKGPAIQADDLPLRQAPVGEPEKVLFLNPGERDALDLRALQAELEKDAILWAMKKTQGDQGKAAALLGLPRTSFVYRLSRLGLANSKPPKKRAKG